jgi:excisionase family DNA binding protein
MKTPDARSEWMTVRDVADELRVGRRTVDKLLKSGAMRSFYVNGRDIRIQRAWFDEWRDAQASGTPDQAA